VAGWRRTSPSNRRILKLRLLILSVGELGKQLRQLPSEERISKNACAMVAIGDSDGPSSGFSYGNAFALLNSTRQPRRAPRPGILTSETLQDLCHSVSGKQLPIVKRQYSRWWTKALSKQLKISEDVELTKICRAGFSLLSDLRRQPRFAAKGLYSSAPHYEVTPHRAHASGSKGLHAPASSAPLG
jgi:hypothetical protein